MVTSSEVRLITTSRLSTSISPSSLLPPRSFSLRTRVWIRWDKHGEHFDWRNDGLGDPWSVLYVFDATAITNFPEQATIRV